MLYQNAERLKLKCGRGLIRTDLDSVELRLLLESPDELFDAAEIFKDSRTTKAGIAKIADIPLLSDSEIFVKRFNNKGPVYTLKYIFREPRPFRVWRAAFALESAGVPTPKPIAAVARYDGIKPLNAYLLRESVPKVIPTLELFEKILSNDSARTAYIDSACELFAKAHDAGIFHGDAKSSNIYAEPTSDSESGYSLGLWDLLSCQIGKKPIAEQMRIKEIKRLATSFAEIAGRLKVEINAEETFELFWSKYHESTK